MTGVCLVSSLTDDEYAKAMALAPGYFASSPCQPMPKMPKPTYRDPAKQRKLAAVVADLRKMTEKHPDHRAETYVGMTVTRGWRMLFSNGHFAVSEPGPSTNADMGSRVLLKGKAQRVGTLKAGAWRDYAPVRPLANERSRAVIWTFTEDRLTFHTKGQPDLGEASAWHPGRFAAAEFCLADPYLWPCRGREWIVSMVGDAIVLTDREQTTQIVVMGMRR